MRHLVIAGWMAIALLARHGWMIWTAWEDDWKVQA